jgi:hypothetical protein
MSESSDAGRAGGTPAPSPRRQRLGALVGQRRSEGHIVSDPPVPITGTDSYERLAGGFFLVHHVDVMIGQRVQALELIGEYDPATDAFIARAHNTDDQPPPSRHDRQVGAQRRRRQLAAVDGHDVHLRRLATHPPQPTPLAVLGWIRWR